MFLLLSGPTVHSLYCVVGKTTNVIPPSQKGQASPLQEIISIHSFQFMYTANSVKVVFTKVLTVNNERSGDDGLLFILALIIGKLPLQQVNLPSYMYPRCSFKQIIPSLEVKISIKTSSLERS